MLGFFFIVAGVALITFQIWHDKPTQDEKQLKRVAYSFNHLKSFLTGAKTGALYDYHYE